MSKPRAKDEADIASEQEQYARDEALWRLRHGQRQVEMAKTCLNCGESTGGGFCDVECRRDFEKRQKHNRKGFA